MSSSISVAIGGGNGGTGGTGGTGGSDQLC